MVSSNDKKMPNGILEEQGMVHRVSGLTLKRTGVHSPVWLSRKLSSLSSSSWVGAAASESLRISLYFGTWCQRSFSLQRRADV